MHRVILIGMKSSGKSTIGRVLSKKLAVPFLDLDTEIEKAYQEQQHEHLDFREIFRKHGRDYFRELETATLHQLATERAAEQVVLSVGGGTPLEERNRVLLRNLGRVVFLDAEEDVLLPRITSGGIPSFFPYPDDPARSLAELLAERRPVYTRLADMVVKTGKTSPEMLAHTIISKLDENKENEKHDAP